MTRIIVTTQAELDAALTNPEITYYEHEIIICNTDGKWITIGSDYGKDIRASGSASVEAFGSATVEASGSATVEASGSATVRAFGSATVLAGKYVAVHLHSARVTHTGGVIIDMTQLDRSDPTTWCDLMGVEVDGAGQVHLFKAVDDDLWAGHAHVKTQYPIGGDPQCDRWIDSNDCGGGLHACPRPGMAKDHSRKATRFLEVTAPLDSIRPIDNTKAKASTFHVLREVDLMGRAVEVEN